MLHSIRWLITSVLFNSGVAYAAFTAFRHPTSLPVLKLWMIIGTLLAFVALLGDTVCAAIPLFFELRCLFVWCLIILEPVAWGSAYDAGCAPALSYVGTSVKSLRNSAGVKQIALTGLVTGVRLLARVMSSAATVGLLQESEQQIHKAMSEVEAALLAEKVLLQAK
jgi:hypothetical protein